MKRIFAASFLALLAQSGAVQPPCPEGSQLMVLNINVNLDVFASLRDDTTWTLTNLCNDELLVNRTADDFAPEEMTNEQWCLNPFQQYQFLIVDGFGDGLGQGNYTLTFAGEIVGEGGRDWRENDTQIFGDPSCFGGSFIVPMPSGGGGDPHFKTWQGKYFDFHGVCDLVLMDVPSYDNGQGLTIHIRTKKRYEYSFIETAALRIGDDIFEVGSWGEYWLNGVESVDFPVSLGDMATVTYKRIDDKKHKFEVQLNDEEDKIVLTTFKDMVSVTNDVKNLERFKDSVGLIGSTSGALIARDGVTRMYKDLEAYGKEWQVRPDEPKLFQNTDRAPQYPETCTMPSAKAVAERRRRLSGLDGITQEDAMKACSKFERESDMDECMYDVLATGDLEMAQAGAF